MGATRRVQGEVWVVALLLLGCTDPVAMPAEEVGLQALDTRVVDTGQDRCFDTTGDIPCPGPGSALFGQDAQYEGIPPSYTVHGNGTVTDRGTNLMPLIRQGKDPEALVSRIADVWTERSDRYSEERGQPEGQRHKVEMYRLGG